MITKIGYRIQQMAVCAVVRGSICSINICFFEFINRVCLQK
jgi:hypothetical protein